MQLHSVKFNWKNNAEAGDKLGVIAQEIQKVLPEVVRDWDYKTIDETSGKKEKVPAERLGVMYADIIPVLIKGMQEQQKEIEDLKQTIQQLNNAQLNALPSAKIIAGNAVSLQQNIPNPVKNFTSINYNIGNSKNAQLNITDATGNVRKQIQLNKESTTLRVDCSMLLAGTYFYTLVIDGKEADSKKMIVEK